MEKRRRVTTVYIVQSQVQVFSACPENVPLSRLNLFGRVCGGIYRAVVVSSSFATQPVKIEAEFTTLRFQRERASHTLKVLHARTYATSECPVAYSPSGVQRFLTYPSHLLLRYPCRQQGLRRKSVRLKLLQKSYKRAQRGQL